MCHGHLRSGEESAAVGVPAYSQADPMGQKPATSSDRVRELFCLTSTETRMFIRDGGRGTKEWRLNLRRRPGRPCRGPPPEQQNVKAVSVRHCATTTAPRNCCPNCYVEQSHEDNARSSAVGKHPKQKKSNSFSLAQLHLPALALFWAGFNSSWESSSPPYSWSRLDSVYNELVLVSL